MDRLFGRPAASGCVDSAEHEYAVPSSLCGIHIKAATLTPLLPPGKRVSVKPATPDPDAITTCEAAVDQLSTAIRGFEPGRKDASALKDLITEMHGGGEDVFALRSEIGLNC
ncbi:MULTISPECIES: hypothetical protein [unclassified Streptomyces]|uniref:hypothetical protein n=1 Tax=unclassified Streptomyces TaxID=2593676 RepID=UPI0036EC8FC4